MKRAKISAKAMIILKVATTPYASGVSNLAITMEVIGVINFDNISVKADHFVALTILLFKLLDIIVIVFLSLKKLYPIRNLPILVFIKRIANKYEIGKTITNPNHGNQYGPTREEKFVL